MTFDEIFECGKLRSKMRAYKNKKLKSIDLCVESLENHRNPYVALSGGKDSVAMAFIVNDAAKKCGKDFKLWVHLSDASFPGTEETCINVSKMIGRELNISRYEQSAFDLLTVDPVQAFGKKGVFFEEVRKYNKTKDLAFVGVRAYESKRRMKAAKSHGSSFFSASMGNIDICNPLQWFDVYDVFAALYEYNAPIHPIYKKISIDNGTNGNGEPYFIRLSYITAKDLWNRGTMIFIKYNYPEIYGKIIEKCPDVSRFT